jgi:hypothetical protein
MRVVLLDACHPTPPESVRLQVAHMHAPLQASSGLPDITENPRTSHRRCSRSFFALCSLPLPPATTSHQLLACHRSRPPRPSLSFVLCHRRLLLLDNLYIFPHRSRHSTSTSDPLINLYLLLIFEASHLGLAFLVWAMPGGLATRAKGRSGALETEGSMPCASLSTGVLARLRPPHFRRVLNFPLRARRVPQRSPGKGVG